MKPFEVQKVPTQYFQKNTMLPFTLPLEGKIGVGYVVLSGQVTISGGTTNGTVFGEGGPFRLIKQIILRANPAPSSRYPGGEVVNCTPRGLIRHGITEYRKLMPDLGACVLGSGAAGVYQVDAVIPIFFADPNVARQWQTALNADPFAYQTLQLEIYTGDLTTCFTGNDRVADFSQLQVRYFDERHNYPGDSFCLFQEDHETFITGQKTDFVDGAMPTQGSFLDWLIMTESVAENTLIDTVLNRLKISGDNFYYEMEAQDVRAKMFTGNWWDMSQSAVGCYLIDFVDGNNVAAINATGLKAQFDVNVPDGALADQLHIFTRRLFSPANMNMTQMPEYAKSSGS